MSFGNRTAVVFGGGGFIGRHLIKRLAKSGAVVRVPSRHPSRLGFLRTTGLVGQIVPEIIDVFDDAQIGAAIRGADLVINLIGILSPTRRVGFERAHAELPGRIAAIATESGAGAFVHVSALGADAASPSAYARSKAAGETAVLAAFPSATILRPSIIFGPEDQFFNRFAAMAMISPVLPLIGGGTTRFQPVYVGDVADAIMAAADQPAARGRIFELGGPTVYTFKELLALLLAETGQKRLLVPIPWGVARIQAAIAERLPTAPLTRDQVALLTRDNVLSGLLPGLSDLAIRPTAAEIILPTYLDRFRKGGRFGQQGRAFP
jgi:NADH dehydrogenase